LSCYDQSKTLPNLKKEIPQLKNIHSQVLQNIATRVELAYQAFFRRAKTKKVKQGFLVLNLGSGMIALLFLSLDSK